MKDKWIMVEIETSANTIIERRQCFGLGGKWTGSSFHYR
jgi:hypothetical protein